MPKYPKVCIIGAESWGSAISTAVCKNVVNDQFDSRVHIYVYDEIVRTNYLSQVMNERHENIKYLPGIKLPLNLIAVNDLLEAAQNADILIFATPHTFVKAYCNILAGNVKETAYAVSLIKGLEHVRDGEIDLYSHAIANQLGIPCYSVMNASSAMEMAQGKLCEITIGCDNEAHSKQLTSLFQTENCMVFTIDDVHGVEMCNTLKDLVSLSAGFIDGLHLGGNARVACLHLGMKEMMRFVKNFNPSTKITTFLESCGLAHSVASSYIDKNVTFAKSFVNSRQTIQEIEANLQNGRKLLGPLIAEEIYGYLEKEDLHAEYPLFSIVHRICQREVQPQAIVDTLRNHPDMRNCSITQMQKNEYIFSEPSTESILENVGDTVPDFLSRTLNGISFEPDSESDIAKRDELWQAYTNFCKTKEVPTELELNEATCSATETINEREFDDGSVEFLFEMGSKDDKPEVYLSLKDTYTQRTEARGKTATDDNFVIDQRVSAVGMNSEFEKYNEFLSKTEQVIHMSQSGTRKPDDGTAPRVGLTDLVERHVRPLNEKYKGMKVTVKGRKEKPVEKNMPEKSNKNVEEKLPTKPTPISKPAASKQTAESTKTVKKPEVSNKVQTNQQTEKTLYDKDSVFGMHLFEDEPNVSRFLELVQTEERKALELEQLRKSKNKNKADEKMKVSKEMPKKGHENKIDNSKIISKSKEQKVDTKSEENKLNPEGYKYDYKISIQSKKVPIDNLLEKHKVPLQYSKSDNSFPTTKAELEAQDYWQKFNFINSYSLDKGNYIERTKDHQEDSPKSCLKTRHVKLPIDNRKKINLYPLDTSTEEPVAIGFMKENQSYFKFQNESQHCSDPSIVYKEHTKEIVMEDKVKDMNSSNINQQSHYLFSGRGSEQRSSCTSLKNNQNIDSPKKNSWITYQSVQPSKSLPRLFRHGNTGDMQPTSEVKDKKLSLEKSSRAETAFFQSSDNEKSKNKEYKNHKETIKFENDREKSYWDYDTEESKQNTDIGFTLPAEVKDVILDDGTPKDIKRVNARPKFYDYENEDIYDKIIDEVVEENAARSNFNVQRYSSKEAKKDENLKSMQKLEAEVEEAIFDKKYTDLKIDHNEDMSKSHNYDYEYDFEPTRSDLDENSSKVTNQIKDVNNFQKLDVELEEAYSDENANTEIKSILDNVVSTQPDHKSLEKSEEPEDDKFLSMEDQEQIISKYLQRAEWAAALSLDKEDVSFAKSNSEVKEMSYNKDHETEEKEEPKFELESGDEDHHILSQVEDEPLPAKSEKDSKKVSPNLYSEWEWLLNNEKFYDALDEFKRDNLDATSFPNEDKAEVSAPEPKKVVKQTLMSNKAKKEASEEVMSVEEANEMESNEKLPQETAEEEGSSLKWVPEKIAVMSQSEPSVQKTEDKQLFESDKRKQLQDKSIDESHNRSLTEKLSDIMTKGQKSHVRTRERPVDYQGSSPFTSDDVLPNDAFKPVHDQSTKKERRVVVKPFHPPLNPRIRIPRPPFDVRDQEYHTVNFRPPPDLLRTNSLPQNQRTAACHATQTGTRSVAKLPRPVFKLPPSMMRSSVLAIELGIFAALISRYSGGRK